MPAKKTARRGGGGNRRTVPPSRPRYETNPIDKTESGASQDAAPSLLLQMASLATSALRLAAKATDASWQAGKALLLTTSPEHAKTMQDTGAFLRDLRELAGLTRSELSAAVDLSDQSLLEAVENGTATLSFELILRLAAVLARHDPVPFIIRFTRTYNPEIWGLLEKWGIGRIPVHLERERQFINIYRSHDTARKLSDEGFAHVLHFTRAAFEMALHFVSQQQKRESAGKRAGKPQKPVNRKSER